MNQEKSKSKSMILIKRHAHTRTNTPYKMGRTHTHPRNANEVQTYEVIEPAAGTFYSTKLYEVIEHTQTCKAPHCLGNKAEDQIRGYKSPAGHGQVCVIIAGATAAMDHCLRRRRRRCLLRGIGWYAAEMGFPCRRERS